VRASGAASAVEHERASLLLVHRERRDLAEPGRLRDDELGAPVDRGAQVAGLACIGVSASMRQVRWR
jgi:hypothetical protein